MAVRRIGATRVYNWQGDARGSCVSRQCETYGIAGRSRAVPRCPVCTLDGYGAVQPRSRVQVEANSGECDGKAASRAWEAHLQRNDSFVVDTMHGQYKSVSVVALHQAGIAAGCCESVMLPCFGEPTTNTPRYVACAEMPQVRTILQRRCSPCTFGGKQRQEYHVPLFLRVWLLLLFRV